MSLLFLEKFTDRPVFEVDKRNTLQNLQLVFEAPLSARGEGSQGSPYRIFRREMWLHNPDINFWPLDFIRGAQLWPAYGGKSLICTVYPVFVLRCINPLIIVTTYQGKPTLKEEHLFGSWFQRFSPIMVRGRAWWKRRGAGIVMLHGRERENCLD